MAFALVGSTVTQTGSDTITSASVIAGATKSTPDGNDRVTVFDFGGNVLDTRGTINMDDGVAFRNFLIAGASNGTWNCGTEKSSPADHRFNYGVDMISVSSTVAAITGLTINMYGQSMWFRGSQLQINSASIFKHCRITSWGRLDLTVTGHIVEGSDITFTSAGVTGLFVRSIPASWVGNRINVVQSNYYFGLSTSTVAGTYPYKNINLLTGQHLVAYGTNTTNAILDIYNVSSGKNYTLDPSTTTSIRRFTLRLNQDVQDIVQDTSFTPIEGAKVFLDGGVGTTIEAVTDVNGEVTQSFYYHQNVVTAGVPATTDFIAGDTLAKRIAALGYNSSVIELVDTRTSEASIGFTRLLVDPYYTNDETANMADVTFTVAANVITAIDITTPMTIDRLWDITRAYLFANMAVADPFAVSGKVMSFPTVNVFNYANLSSGTKLTSFISANIDSLITATGITSATIYPTSGDRDANTNAGATFTTTLLFAHGQPLAGVTMSGTIYLRLLVGSTTLLTELTLVPGANELDLGVQGQLVTLGEQINTKPTLAEIEASTTLAKEASVKLAIAISA